MKGEEERAKAGLHVNLKRTRMMIREETHGFIRQRRYCNCSRFYWFCHRFHQMQPRSHVEAETGKGSNGRTRKGHQEHRCVIRTKAETSHPLVLPIPLHGIS